MNVHTHFPFRVKNIQLLILFPPFFFLPFSTHFVDTSLSSRMRKEQKLQTTSQRSLIREQFQPQRDYFTAMQNVHQSEIGIPINLWTHHRQSFYRQQLNAAASSHVSPIRGNRGSKDYHFTFRPNLLSSREWAAVIRIRAAQSWSIFSFPLPAAAIKHRT